VQLRLAGFRGTVPDGDFGPGTERQAMSFQGDFMKIPPTGVVDRATMQAIDGFAKRYAIDFKALEPSNIAPTWVHYDVRCYEPRYLEDQWFCTTAKQLDSRKPIRF